MSEERERLQARLDEAFASMRPRAGFEEELLRRIRPPQAASRGRPDAGWWGWAGAAAAVLLVAGLGFLVLHGSGGARSGGTGAMSAGGARPAMTQALAAAGFGRLPRPATGSPPVSDAALAPLPGPEGAQYGSGRAASTAATGTVTRYVEPSPADLDAFARTLGATGRGAIYSGPGLTLRFFPTDAKLGLQAHYVLTPEGPQPSGPPPPDQVARASADAFLQQRGLAVQAAAVTVADQGPLALVRYTDPPSGPVTVLVRGDGGVFQASGPIPVRYEQSSYALASLDGLRAQAHAGSGDRAEYVTLLASDGRYWYLEPAVRFVSAAGAAVVVPAVDPSQLR